MADRRTRQLARMSDKRLIEEVGAAVRALEEAARQVGDVTAALDARRDLIDPGPSGIGQHYGRAIDVLGQLDAAIVALRAHLTTSPGTPSTAAGTPEFLGRAGPMQPRATGWAGR